MTKQDNFWTYLSFLGDFIEITIRKTFSHNIDNYISKLLLLKLMKYFNPSQIQPSYKLHLHYIYTKLHLHHTQLKKRLQMLNTILNPRMENQENMAPLTKLHHFKKGSFVYQKCRNSFVWFFWYEFFPHFRYPIKWNYSQSRNILNKNLENCFRAQRFNFLTKYFWKKPSLSFFNFRVP